nr:DNA adenine methylase [Picosynechococcus sp. NKBG042902]
MSMVNPENLTPPLKWAGGKRWLVPTLKPIWEDYQDFQLIEPFCGGLAIALGLAPQKSTLNDINPHLINFYKQLKKGLKINISMANDADLYYQYREQFNELIRNKKQEVRKLQLYFIISIVRDLMVYVALIQKGDSMFLLANINELITSMILLLIKQFLKIGNFNGEILNILKLIKKALFMQIRPMMWNSANTLQGALPGKIRNV